jgi:serine/threonine-protein kinase
LALSGPYADAVSLRPDPLLGAVLAGYRIESVVGKGGMSVVYLAEHERLHRKAALKLLAPELAENESFRDRFLRESEIAAQLDHPNVIPIFDAGEFDGVLYIAMRYVDGTDLGARLERDGALEPAAALAIPRRWRAPSTRRTPAASCTATSSRRTCCSRRATTSIWPTSASRNR